MFEWITGSVWQETMEWLYGELIKCVGEFFGFISESLGSSLFQLAWIQAIVKLFSYLGWALFITGLVVTVFDTAIEVQSGRGDIKGNALNILRGFMAVSLFTTVPVRMFEFCVSAQNIFSRDLAGLLQTTTVDFTDLLDKSLSVQIFAVPGLFSGFVIIALGYCVLKVFFANIKRGGILLIMVSVGSLHMFSVPRGYIDGFIQWVKQVVALCLTAFLQMTLLIAGLITWQENALIGIGIMLSAGEIDRIAGMFGLDTSVKGNVMGAVYATQSVVNITRTILARG